MRFFVEGRGLFSLHIEDEVLTVLCERGDLIHVPAGTKHWFDMGSQPQFCALRFFNNPAGWVAGFNNDPIAERFPQAGLSRTETADAFSLRNGMSIPVPAARPAGGPGSHRYRAERGGRRTG